MTSDHTPAYTAPDLTTCDQEPIHVPGAIQPHGLLLALDQDERVVMASRNCADLLGIPARDLSGMRLQDVLGPEPARLVPRALAEGDVSAPLRTTLPPGQGTLAGQDVDLIVHRSGTRVVVELEPVSDPVPSQHVSYRSARAAVTRLTQSSTVPELCDQLASEIRRLTGFDRVMVYRFDENWNGEVIAEQRREHLNPFLGLHYPSTDIPAQARRLYTVNWTRLIADIGYDPVAIDPVLDPATGAPLDLSHSVLRSVSPIHIEYLSNMGVSASMSVSMVKDGQLWGLVACHHYSGPLRVSYDARSAAEFLGQTASQLVHDRARADTRTDELLASVNLARITADLASDQRPVYDTLLQDSRLLGLVDATGVALWVEGSMSTLGDVPPEHVLHTIAARLGEGGEVSGRPVASSHLQALDPELAAFSDVAAGAMYIGNGPDRWMMWLRPELERSVDWGGDPYNKALALAEDPTVRLSPRKSFAKWQETVRGHSAPWEPWQLGAVESLRAHLASELVRRSHEHAALAESLQRTLVLDEAPQVDGLDIHARYRPAQGSQLGGDWWDAFPLADGRITVSVGDVSGHGVSAATAMAQVRTALRAYMIDGHSPAACVDRLDVLMESLLPGQTATVVVLVVDPATGHVELANAGHPSPLLLQGDGCEPMPMAGRPLLGVGAGSARTDSLTLDEGDILLVYTDGVVERRGVQIDTSIRRLSEAASSSDHSDTLDAWIDNLLTAVPGTLDDDLTIVAVRMAARA
ncbi:SpoIIE family protein phosphatase [Aeromicrobium wangtongii]|uniref:SpoIIE family protein phosphatase n=1 Tax=Aeromicrobium wangtongii TaxID=2969247 RepID=A0ABY5M6T1_9ACTN|nr:SpoIIE family protein phosphatase [Aeromicrobium wangtongii]MCD9199512.1 SpoIIE family protein phosphatase [Aeromicrobium wangtongii]UUP13865.1 SpoIIE family protein phosphatase [Aeromicrobium wangtongii]